MDTPEIVIKRFWDKVEIGDNQECWEWKAYRDDCGYGMFLFNHKLQRSHRVSWQLKNGRIPSKMYICHKCDNPSCVNPNHLFIGTQKDNVQDCLNKGRHNYEYMRGDRHYAKKHPELAVRGERQGSAKLTSNKVILMRSLREIDPTIYSYSVLSRIFSVCITQVKNIIKGYDWRHLLIPKDDKC